MLQESETERAVFLIQVLTDLLADDRQQLVESLLFFGPLSTHLVFKFFFNEVLVVSLWDYPLIEHFFPDVTKGLEFLSLILT